MAEGRNDAPDGDFMPGELLSTYLDYDGMRETAEGARDLHDVSELGTSEREMVESFWTNGASRVAGREYDAMIRSACYLEGGMSCITCHTMHGAATDAQLPLEADSEHLCGGACHADIVADPSAHTHHDAESVGSACVSCHMPYASYGLLGATRSHRLDSPVAGGLEGFLIHVGQH